MGDDLEDLSAQISGWRDDDEAAAAAATRSRRYWLARQAAESTTLVGVLLTLAERRAAVTIRTPAGPLHGTITSVTTALCTVDLGSGQALIPVAAITALDAAGPDIIDDRTPSAITNLAAVLADMVAERPAVALHLSDTTTVRGTLAKVGVDVVSLTVGPGDGMTHVALGAIAVCVLP